jgi:WD40 repeat protein
LGTEGFIPPEGPGTPQADIYSLGKVLYEIATGKDRHEFPALPTLLGDSATDSHFLELNSVFLKACQAETKQRYKSALEMREDLLLLRSGRSVKRSQAIERRLRLLSQISLVGTTVTILIAVSYFYEQRRVRVETQLRQNAQRESARADQQAKIAAQEAEQSRRLLVQLDVDNAVRLMNSGDYLKALVWAVDALRRDEPPAGAKRAHRARIAGLLEASPALVSSWRETNAVAQVIFTPDGKRLITVTGDSGNYGSRIEGGTAQVREVKSGALLAQVPVPGGGTAVLSEDGARLVTASWTGELRVWNASTGEPISPLMRHSGGATSVAITRDGQWVCSAGRDHTARIWDARSGELFTPPLQHNDMADLALSPDGRVLATISAGRELYLWEMPSGKKLPISVDLAGAALDLKFSHDGQWLALGTMGGEVRVVSARTGQLRWPPLADAGGSQVTFSPDDRFLLSSGWGAAARIWRLEQSPPRSVLLPDEFNVKAVAFSPDGRLALTGSYGQFARVWDASTGDPLTPPLHHRSQVNVVAFSPNGGRFAVATEAGTVTIWELARRNTPILLPHQAPVTAVACNATGSLALTADQNFVVQLWDTENGRRIGPGIHHQRAISRMVLSADGKSVLTASYDRTARLWDADTGHPRTPPLTHADVVSWAAFSPDQRRVATASYDRTARVWEAETGRPLTPPLSHAREVDNVEFSSNGQWIVTACRDECAYLWDVDSGQLLKRIEINDGSWVFRARFGPGDSNVFAMTFNCLHARNRISGEPTFGCLRSGQWLATTCFTADARHVFIASYDGRAGIWDTVGGHPSTPPLTMKPALGAQFDRDDHWLGIIDQGQALRMCDGQSGEPVLPPLQTGGEGANLTMSADGHTIICAADNLALVRRWSEETRPALELVQMAAVLSGTRLDENGRLVELNQSEWEVNWHALSPRDNAMTPLDLLRWHRHELTRSLQERHWFGARFHLDQLARLGADAAELTQVEADLAASQAAPGPGTELQRWTREVQGRIPPRASDTAKALLDLSNFYNRTLTEELNQQDRQDMNTFSELPRGVHSLAGDQFDIRGAVLINGQQLSRQRPSIAPERVQGIPVRQKAGRLQFLQGTGWNEEDGTVIAKYIVHYADGTTPVEIPVRYGANVRNYWVRDNDVPESPGAIVAWVGTNPTMLRAGLRCRIYRQQWDNPEPEKEISHLDFVSTMSNCAPALFAVTAER